MHWRRPTVDIRLFAEFGPTISLGEQTSSRTWFQGFLILGLLFPLRAVFVQTELGVGFGQSRLEHYHVDGEDYDFSFASFGFVGVGAGYSNGNFSIGPALRVHLGRGYEGEYYASIGDVEHYYVGISAGIQTEYAW